MDLHYYINTLRKFWIFMEGLYPVLSRVRQRAGTAASRLDAFGVKEFSKRRLESQRGKALKGVGEDLYWRDLSRERDILAGLSPESQLVLRPVFLLSVVLCFMLPLTLLLPYPALAPSAITGAGGPVAGWSAVLWMLATAMAWGCLLAGAGSANRPAVVLAADLYLFIMVIMSPAGSRLNFIPASTVLLTAAVCERRMKSPGLRNKCAGLMMGLLIGIPCGVFLWKSLPLWTMSTEASLVGRLVLGGMLGLLAFLLGRTDEAHPRLQALTAFLLPIHRMVWTAGALTLLFLSGLVFSMDFGLFAEVLLRGERYLTSLFWPAWYFIGVGIIFRLLKNSDIMTRAIQDIIRPSLFIPITLMLLAVALAMTLSYNLIMFTDLDLWPEWVLLAAWKIYKATRYALWDNPMYSFSLELMTWVFVFDLLAVAWLAMKRMLNSERVAGLLFYTVLAWFVVLEYYFESFSLTWSNRYSVFLLFLSSLWLLWFFISLGLRKSTNSSPLWPASARLPIYGAVLLFTLLLLHARTAIRDFSVVNEFFFFLFRGVIDVGLPYVLYVYAGRRLGELPVPLSRLFVFFCLGGALTIPLTVMDKLAMVNWSWPALQAIVDAQYEQLMVQGLSPANQAAVLPMDWIAARALLVMAILLISAVGVKRTNTGRPECTARVLFFVTALAMGLAAFSNTLIVLPFVPPRLELFYRPLHQSLMLDHDLFFLFLAYNIPALILALSLTIPKGRFALLQAAGLIAAGMTHLGLRLIWPAYKYSLLSTGLADTLVIGGIALFVLLIYRARIRLDSGQPSTAVETVAVATAAPANGFTGIPAAATGLQGAAPTGPVVGPVARIVFVVAGSAIFSGVALFQWHTGHFVPNAEPGKASETRGVGRSPGPASPRIGLPAGFLFQKVPGLPDKLPLSAAWVPVPSEKLPPKVKAMFIRKEKGEWKPVLSVGLEPSTGRDLKEILGKLEEQLRNEAGLNYRRIRMEDWGHIFPGALAEDYHLDVGGPEGRVFHLMATTVLLSQAGGTAAVLTVTCEPVDWEAIRAELIQTAQLFSGSGIRPE